MQVQDMVLMELSADIKPVRIDPTASDATYASKDIVGKLEQLSKMYTAGQTLMTTIRSSKARRAADGSMHFDDDERNRMIGRVLRGFQQIRKLVREVGDDMAAQQWMDQKELEKLQAAAERKKARGLGPGPSAE